MQGAGRASAQDPGHSDKAAARRMRRCAGAVNNINKFQGPVHDRSAAEALQLKDEDCTGNTITRFRTTHEHNRLYLRCAHACRLITALQRRSRALAHLPGPKPKYWLPGFMGLIVRRDPHRYSTVLAERFGPIFKFRVLWYHVRPPFPPVLWPETQPSWQQHAIAQ